MLFTCGKNRQYERMMKEVPGFHKENISTNKGSNVRFKYKYADIDCTCCDEHKACGHELCPHIMENLADLTADKDFLYAVEVAETCKTAQKRTLQYIKKQIKE